jgi:hypothetical protein
MARRVRQRIVVLVYGCASRRAKEHDFENEQSVSSRVRLLVERPRFLGHLPIACVFGIVEPMTFGNPLTGTVVGNFPLPEGAIDINRLVPDSTLNPGELLSQIDCVADGSSGTCFLVSTFHLSDFSFVNSLELSNIRNVVGAINMIRRRPTGLAFNTDTGKAYLVDISTLLQPASTQGAAARQTLQRHDLVRNHGRIVTTTQRRWHATDSNQIE